MRVKLIGRVVYYGRNWENVLFLDGLVQSFSSFNLCKNKLMSLLKQICISNVLLGDTSAADLKTPICESLF